MSNLNRLPSHVPSCYMRLNSQFVYVERDLRELKLTSNLGSYSLILTSFLLFP
ncbi:hypothetical protein ISN45_Un107g000250 (mitochondrion) [Arabidopsis thaliana x Arabidopsis arenosa]|uniref:Uncharacterized protein n=2 Tax=Arabidopsis TaxID=3701 RepID=A0A8T1XA20_ARASU|nr:hypothetical protein ISN44_Un239g000130 [Arabidopsis suecica]KAG7528741.1 hypothetical protein ISN44_Un159g000010 [Arabidopsis suecica]KAG7528949.1 hypothetical protein ISN45_Un107g000250 [Arabidopsis thaliana x Arabidopsis arenosa]KAG7529221.1 hypothetical protein ISN44_Un144g000210 [Arabidopsis suecica]